MVKKDKGVIKFVEEICPTCVWYVMNKQYMLDILESGDIDWGSYIKGKGAYEYFDSKSFIEKEIKPRLKR